LLAKAEEVMNKSSVTVIDIAREAGVSKSTVSLVLRDSPLVHAETRVKVQAAIEKLGYVYNRSAANLRQSKSKIIGLVVNDLTNSFFAELAVGVDRVMQSAGYVQFLANTGESIDRQREVIASMREHGIAGLIVSPARGTESGDLCRVLAFRPYCPTIAAAWQRPLSISSASGTATSPSWAVMRIRPCLPSVFPAIALVSNRPVSSLTMRWSSHRPRRGRAVWKQWNACCCWVLSRRLRCVSTMRWHLAFATVCALRIWNPDAISAWSASTM
jgi:transcriptional regulator with XRE-family HTH domain